MAYHLNINYLIGHSGWKYTLMANKYAYAGFRGFFIVHGGR